MSLATRFMALISLSIVSTSIPAASTLIGRALVCSKR